MHGHIFFENGGHMVFFLKTSVSILDCQICTHTLPYFKKEHLKLQI